MWTELSDLYYALVLCSEFKGRMYMYVYLLLHTVSWFLCPVLCTSCIFRHYTNGLFICLSLVWGLRSLQKRARFYECVFTALKLWLESLSHVRGTLLVLSFNSAEFVFTAPIAELHCSVEKCVLRLSYISLCYVSNCFRILVVFTNAGSP